MKRIAFTLAALAIGLGACSQAPTPRSGASATPSTSTPAGVSTITGKSFAWTPQSLTVQAGTTVTWNNTDQILHTATAGSGPDHKTGLFDGQMTGAGASFHFTFTKPGTYQYFCSRHFTVPSMHGTIIVT